MRRGIGRAAIFGTGVLALLSTAACAPEVACPAVGWINELVIDLEGAAEHLDEVHVCIDGECALAERLDMGEWLARMDMSSPPDVIVRVSSSDGAVLAEEEIHPEWVRVGGSEQCGGPMRASVVVDLGDS